MRAYNRAGRPSRRRLNRQAAAHRQPEPRPDAAAFALVAERRQRTRRITAPECARGLTVTRLSPPRPFHPQAGARDLNFGFVDIYQSHERRASGQRTPCGFHSAGRRRRVTHRPRRQNDVSGRGRLPSRKCQATSAPSDASASHEVAAALAPVAQLDRAPDYESGGQRFESFRARHLLHDNLAQKPRSAINRPWRGALRWIARASSGAVLLLPPARRPHGH